MEKKYILSQAAAMMKLRRMAYEIMENNIGQSKIILAGIMVNGYAIAQHIKQYLNDDFSIEIDLLEIKINKNNPLDCTVEHAELAMDHVLIIVDDVVNSGKTLLYALTPFLQHSPLKIQTLTLVERSYKTFPVHIDYVGVSLSTTFKDHIQVNVENGIVMGAYLD